MASIADSMTLDRWLRAKTELILDLSDDFIYATFLHRGVEDSDLLVSDVSEKTRDLILADTYFGAAVSSVKSGTQGEADGGWTHYVAIKNVVNRDALLRMANELYAKWGEPIVDLRTKIQMKNLY